MRYGRILVLLLLGIAIPATAQTFGFSLGAAEPCLALGSAAYRLVTPDAPADYTIRIDPASPDLRVRLSDTPDEADFVLVDDGETAPGCGSRSRSAVRTVRIDPTAPAPDIIVGLATAPAPADYRIYLRTTALDPMTAAALLAAARVAARRHAANPSN